VKQLEERLGQGALADIARLVGIYEVAERDAMAILIRYALDRMAAEDVDLYFSEYARRPDPVPASMLRRDLILSPSDADTVEMRNLRAELNAERHYATHDVLTGLWNRRAAMEALERWTPMVALCDVDRFKSINDEYGHAVGDHVLTGIGARLTGAMNGRGTAYRLGGDEFMLIWDDHSLSPLAEINRVWAATCKALTITEEMVITPYLSFGAAETQGTGRVGRMLLSLADAQMYQAKTGRYDPRISLAQLN
jgi:diguanylate cyclase (GGDEF)-like protein